MRNEEEGRRRPKTEVKYAHFSTLDGREQTGRERQSERMRYEGGERQRCRVGKRKAYGEG